jgi:hypothetical protein
MSAPASIASSASARLPAWQISGTPASRTRAPSAGVAERQHDRARRALEHEVKDLRGARQRPRDEAATDRGVARRVELGRHPRHVGVAAADEPEAARLADRRRQPTARRDRHRRRDHRVHDPYRPRQACRNDLDHLLVPHGADWIQPGGRRSVANSGTGTSPVPPVAALRSRSCARQRDPSERPASRGKQAAASPVPAPPSGAAGDVPGLDRRGALSTRDRTPRFPLSGHWRPLSGTHSPSTSRMPIRSSKPAGRSSPPPGWFDSIAAP